MAITTPMILSIPLAVLLPGLRRTAPAAAAQIRPARCRIRGIRN